MTFYVFLIFPFLKKKYNNKKSLHTRAHTHTHKSESPVLLRTPPDLCAVFGCGRLVIKNKKRGALSQHTTALLFASRLALQRQPPLTLPHTNPPPTPSASRPSPPLMFYCFAATRCPNSHAYPRTRTDLYAYRGKSMPLPAPPLCIALFLPESPNFVLFSRSVCQRQSQLQPRRLMKRISIALSLPMDTTSPQVPAPTDTSPPPRNTPTDFSTCTARFTFYVHTTPLLPSTPSPTHSVCLSVLRPPPPVSPPHSCTAPSLSISPCACVNTTVRV